MAFVVVEFTGRAVVEIDESLVVPDFGVDLDATVRHIAEDDVAALCEDALTDIRIEVQTSWIRD